MADLQRLPVGGADVIGLDADGRDLATGRLQQEREVPDVDRRRFRRAELGLQPLGDLGGGPGSRGVVSADHETHQDHQAEQDDDHHP